MAAPRQFELRFDDSRLDDRAVLADHDAVLRQLAMLGARVRIEASQASCPDLDQDAHPRGIVAVGSEARLIRAVLEPACPVPFVAWQLAGLPAWVGPLDLVVVVATGGADAEATATVAEAVRRGCTLLVAAPADSAIAAAAASNSTWLLPTRSGDPLAAAVVLLSQLHALRVGPEVHPENVAECADMVAEESSPFQDLSTNPAKDLALGLADANALVWGGSVLAARASRRIAEALRRSSGRPALAADAEHLTPILAAVPPLDPFADPDDADRGAGLALRPVLVVLDDDQTDAAAAQAGQRLERLADAHQVRTCHLGAGQGGEVDRYVTLLQKGCYGAAYLGIGLGLAAEL